MVLNKQQGYALVNVLAVLSIIVTLVSGVIDSSLNQNKITQVSSFNHFLESAALSMIELIIQQSLQLNDPNNLLYQASALKNNTYPTILVCINNKQLTTECSNMPAFSEKLPYNQIHAKASIKFWCDTYIDDSLGTSINNQDAMKRIFVINSIASRKNHLQKISFDQFISVQGPAVNYKKPCR